VKICRAFAVVVSATTLIAGCGGGGGSSNASSNQTPQPRTFTMSTTSGTGGTVNPVSRVVNSGTTANFTVTPEADYNIENVSGCGGSLSGQTYTTGAASANCTISASFALKTFDVTATATVGGTISPASQTVTINQAAQFALSLEAGQQVKSVSGCGGTLTGLDYITGPITGSCEVAAEFEPIPNSPASVDAGNKQSVEENDTVVLTGSASDTDGTVASYAWSQTFGPAVVLQDATTQTASFDAIGFSGDQTLTFELSVTDDDGAVSTDTVDVSVNNFFDHTVILRVVRVTPDWMPYASTDGWTQAVTIKHSAKVKYYEVAIWEETASVHLYEFDNNYDASYGSAPGRTDADKIAYREAFAIRRVENMPQITDAASRDARSVFLRDAFEEFADYLASTHPNSEHGLMYSGHGGPTGALFEVLMRPPDAVRFLNQWTTILGRNLGFIDMGGPCNKGSMSDLRSFCSFSDYYIASDLPNGGFTFDDFTIEKFRETAAEYRYHDLFRDGVNLRDVMRRRIDLRRTRYEYSRDNMIANKVEQGNYLYKCSTFGELDQIVTNFVTGRASFNATTDLKSYVEDNGGDSEIDEYLDALIIHAANNRDFFHWEVQANGLSMFNP